jgi:predicted ribosome quality control (RQC) complex YloA/Tae2 family protein
LRTELERRKRRLVAIEQDRARVADAAELRARANLVLANLHALGGAAGEIELDDFTADPPAKRCISIDPSLGARAQCEAWFQRARKLERGAELSKERAATTEREITAIGALYERVLAAQALDALGPLTEEARRFGVAPETATEPRKHKPATRVPYREFRGSAGRAILVGRGAADNDALTLRHAKPHDLWLHVRDDSGAHVVVPLARNESCPPELLCDAATLAAPFSSARGADRADVIYTPRRYVQKPRKSATGSVSVLREKVFRLQLEPARLKRLLASEVAA